MSFSLMIGLGSAICHAVIYLWLVRRLVAHPLKRRVFLGVFVAMTILLAMRRPLREIGASRLYEWVGYPWLGVLMTMTVAVAIGAVIERVIIAARQRARAGSPRPPPAEDATVEATAVARRDLLKVVPVGVLAAGGVGAGYGKYRAFTAPELTDVPVPIAKLPASLEGMTIVQLTDVHVGSFIGESFIDMLVAATNDTKPDLVVITGDLVDGSVAELGDAVGALARLRSRFGTFFVTGNHEYYSGDVAWVAFLERIGVRVLRNTRATIGDPGGSIDLVGVDDWSGARRSARKGYDLEAALHGRDPDRAAILLAHQPANFEVVASRGLDLQISGHTHGGQVFPMSRLVALRHPYHRGLYQHRESLLYVSRGCGFWGPPSRIDSPPELVRYVLGRR